jgi:hypothetical protein
VEEWTLQQKIAIYGISIPLAIFLWALILLKLADWAQDGWCNNNRKKKWAVCLIIGFYLVLSNLDKAFPDMFGS